MRRCSCKRKRQNLESQEVATNANELPNLLMQDVDVQKFLAEKETCDGIEAEGCSTIRPY